MAVRWLLLCGLLWSLCGSGSQAADPFHLTLRSRMETGESTGRFNAVYKTEAWEPQRTAIIVCDMWDLHHCLNATRRGAEVAPRMNEFLNKARAAGAIIIHAPSGCMETYRDHPARHRATAVPKSKNLPEEIQSWCYRIPSEEKGQYPIDQTDGGEDDDPAEHAEWAKKLADMGRNPKAPWKSQTSLLTIDGSKDFISDNGEEVWSILEAHDRPNVMLTGVHTNMCVLGRPFGLRQMAKNGKHVVLVRDLTDTMYNPLRKPFVSHFTGTDLIVEHIEKWVCPTITSDQILSGRPFRFQHDQRPRLAVVMAEPEYRTNETLPPFALNELGKTFAVSQVFAEKDGTSDLPGLVEALSDADAVLLSIRRRPLPPAEMKAIREFIAGGKAVIGIRTTSHAFSLRGKAPPDGFQTWETFDPEVIGGNYQNHYGPTPAVHVTVAAGAAGHPILNGVDLSALKGTGSLYQVSPLTKSTTPLLLGTIEGKPTEPIVWLNQPAGGGKVFYTSLGHIGEFEQPAFRRLLSNAVHWAAGIEPLTGNVPPGR
jgi:type 1 glutamine amidotransferase/nicotinamidase-related amidase